MTRHSTWEADLNAYLAQHRRSEFQWGSLDCGLFFAGACEAMTGFDPGEPFRGKYTTELGAAKALKKHGAGDLESTLDGLFEVIEPGFVQRGDGVWDGERVGISVGAYAFMIGEERDEEGNVVRTGLIRIPRAEWLKGWRVG